jgi:hypothetical protein
MLTDVSEQLLPPPTLMMEAMNFSETSLSIYQATQCSIPENSNLRTDIVIEKRGGNLKKVKIMPVVHQTKRDDAETFQMGCDTLWT